MMQKAFSVHPFLFVALILLCFTGCNGCEPTTYPDAQIQVKCFSGETLEDTMLTFLEIYGLGREDSLLYKDTTLNVVSLPINLNEDSTAYFFARIYSNSMSIDTLMDTLSINYSQLIELNPPNCQFNNNINNIILGNNTTFDSIAVLQNFIDEGDRENIGIYF